MKKKQTRAFKTHTPIEAYHAHEPGTKVIAQNTKHSGIGPGSKGEIIARHPSGGYAVEFEVVVRVSLFGGATYTETAVIYLEPHEFIVDATRLHETQAQGSNGEAPALNAQSGPIVNDSGQGGA